MNGFCNFLIFNNLDSLRYVQIYDIKMNGFCNFLIFNSLDSMRYVQIYDIKMNGFCNFLIFLVASSNPNQQMLHCHIVECT